MTPEQEHDAQWRQRIEHKVDQLIISIKGDKDMGHRGLADRVEAVEKKVDGHNAKLLTWGGIVIGASAAVRFIFGK